MEDTPTPRPACLSLRSCNSILVLISVPELESHAMNCRLAWLKSAIYKLCAVLGSGPLRKRILCRGSQTRVNKNE
jgi:hypothetical protein